METAVLALWAAAAALYAVFWSWYVGFGSRIRQEEIDALMRLLASHGEGGERIEILRRFLEQDNGRGFVMVNLLQLKEPKAPARDAMMNYQKRFMGRLLRLAGHPLFVGRAATGRNIEQWGIEADGWDVAGLVRYRSRRDVARMVAFSFETDAREFKHVALQRTLAFPADPWVGAGGPCVVVALALALGAALLQIALF